MPAPSPFPALIPDPSILAKRDARMKAEGLREALDAAINEPKGVVPESADAFYDYTAGRVRPRRPTGEPDR